MTTVNAMSKSEFVKGMLTALRKDGFFYCDSQIFGRVINKVYQMPLKDLI